ncbi:MAG TPA: bifunctional 5,10-methylenetetrahydrofolate dehydrogenase/5,10-methenyltetrahydrofolate cyclohydrolase [Candidatus Dormibacteraeota bacterium]|nr:bifunctional 5,10-methylenetetrahydrofolate dehydrogenase/5,10-methenyltetrahydrofolate cyclohydrolase [Candidatus Dormibacteraeota bacterium]
MKLLSGKELAGYIKERQSREARTLGQTLGVFPKLAIIVTVENIAINTYVRLKKSYGADISIAVDIYRIKQSEVPDVLNKLNKDPTVHGIIVQLPLDVPAQTDEIVNLVAPEKDVDALGRNAQFEPATPMAILWLLSGYNIDLRGKKVLLVGRGKLVGAPLEKILDSSGIAVESIDRSAKDLSKHTTDADIIITATGSPAILYPAMIKQNAVVIDAGVASESGKTVGDLAPEVYEREDLTITPAKGGVGPLTICALFENVILAARRATLK